MGLEKGTVGAVVLLMVIVGAGIALGAGPAAAGAGDVVLLNDDEEEVGIYDNISTALEDADDEHSIVVKHDITEDETVVVDKSVAILANGDIEVTFDGGGDTFHVEANEVAFAANATGDSFTITGGDETAFVVDDGVSDTAITNSTVKDHVTGVEVGDADSTAINEMTFDGQTVGVHVTGAATETAIADSTFTGVETGVQIDGAASETAIDDDVVFNAETGDEVGVNVGSEATETAIKAEFDGLETGVLVDGAEKTAVSGATFESVTTGVFGEGTNELLLNESTFTGVDTGVQIDGAASETAIDDDVVFEADNGDGKVGVNVGSEATETVIKAEFDGLETGVLVDGAEKTAVSGATFESVTTGVFGEGSNELLVNESTFDGVETGVQIDGAASETAIDDDVVFNAETGDEVGVYIGSEATETAIKAEFDGLETGVLVDGAEKTAVSGATFDSVETGVVFGEGTDALLVNESTFTGVETGVVADDEASASGVFVVENVFESPADGVPIVLGDLETSDTLEEFLDFDPDLDADEIDTDNIDNLVFDNEIYLSDTGSADGAIVVSGDAKNLAIASNEIGGDYLDSAVIAAMDGEFDRLQIAGNDLTDVGNAGIGILVDGSELDGAIIGNELPDVTDDEGAGIFVGADDATTADIEVRLNDVSDNDVGVSIDLQSVESADIDVSELFAPDTDEAAMSVSIDDTSVDSFSVAQSALNDSAGDGLVLAATGQSSVTDVTIEEALFADNGGTGIAIDADDATVDGATFQRALVEENDHGIILNTANDGEIRNVTVESVFISNNVETGVALNADDGGVIDDVSLSQFGIEGSASGLDLRADGGTIGDVTVEEALINDGGTGVNLDAVNTAIEDVVISGVIIENNEVGVGVANGHADEFDGVEITESAIRENTVAGVQVSDDVTSDLTAEDIEVSRNVIRGNGVGVLSVDSSTQIEATRNFWGDSTGPSSVGSESLADPVTGALADGDGDSVSEGENGNSNVNFSPAIGGATVCDEGQLLDPIPGDEEFEITIDGASFSEEVEDRSFEIDVEGETIGGPLTDFAGVCVWERMPLPLRTTDATAATSIDNLDLFLDVGEADINANRGSINVHQQDEEVGLTFQRAVDANPDRFANQDAQVIIVGPSDESSDAFEFDIDEETGEVTFGADAVDVEIQDIELDDDGELQTSFTPEENGAYVAMVATVPFGDGFTKDDGNITVDALETEMTIAGIETIAVQATSSEATPDRNEVSQGEELTFTLDANPDGTVDEINHALVMYDEESFVDTTLILGANGELHGDDYEDFDNLSIDGEISATVIRDGETEEISISADGPVTDIANDVTIAGEITPIDTIAGVVEDGDGVVEVTVEVGEDFRPGEYRFVHAASTDDGTFSTDDGTVEVLEVVDEEADLQITDAELSEDEIEEGESVDVTATVENVGELQGSKELELRVDDETVDTREVTVNAGETITETFTHTFDDAGEYEIAVNDVVAGMLTVTEPDDEPVPAPPGAGPPPADPTDPDEVVPIEGVVPPENPNRVDFVVPDDSSVGTLQFDIPENDETRAAGTRFTQISARSITSSGFTVSITSTRAAPEGVTPLEGNPRSALLYADIDYTTRPGAFTDSTFEFEVTQERLGDAAPSDIALYRYDEATDDWDHLETEVLEQGEDVTRFRAEADGFSVYAIGQQEADIQVTEASLSETEIEVGETVDVEAVVENQAEGAGSETIDLLVDGEVVDSQEVTLEGGESETVTFTEAFDESGEFDIEVDDVFAGTLTVLDEPTPTPTEAPDPTDTLGILIYIVPVLLILIAIIGGVYLYRQRDAE